MQGRKPFSVGKYPLRYLVMGTPSIPRCDSAECFFNKKSHRKRKFNRRRMELARQTLSPPQKLYQFRYPDEKSQMLSKTQTTALTELSVVSASIQMTKIKNKRSIIKMANQRKITDINNEEDLSYESQYQDTLRKANFNAQRRFENQRRINLDSFQLIQKIGQGTYSEVFLVLEKNLGFLCTLKVLSKEKLQQNQLVSVFIREAKIHHYMDHPHVIQLYGIFHDPENIYLICEYAPNRDLFQLIRKKRHQCQSFTLQQTSILIKQLSRAVLSMHENFLMHRDIKPENIFLSIGDSVKLGDFGWSVYNVDKALRSTQCGTPLYLAPELIGKGEYSDSVDVWAIGVLTYELLTGEVPFRMYTPRDLQKVLYQSIDYELIQNSLAKDLVMKLLQRDPQFRIQVDDVLDHPFIQTYGKEEYSANF